MADTPEEIAERLERAKQEGLAKQRVDRAIKQQREAAARKTNPLRAGFNTSEKL